MPNETQQNELEDAIADLEPPYESEQERRIGRLLDKYGLPFFYRQPTIVQDQGRNQIIHPSFTLLTYDGAVIDYVAERDAGQRIRKKQLYRYNQIPAVVLGPPDLDKPNWDANLYEKLRRMSRQTFDPMPYAPVNADRQQPQC